MTGLKNCKQFGIPLLDGSCWSQLKFNKKKLKKKKSRIQSSGGVDKIAF
jgi:hypothetical protein